MHSRLPETMNPPLPDAAAITSPTDPMPLEWVGMEGIDLPLVIDEPGYRREHHARVDAQVNLPRPEVRGIHMSRLYQLVDSLGDGTAVSPGCLGPMLQAMLDSHQDCGPTRARLRLRFRLLLRRSALQSPDIGGWRSYPVTLEATGDGAAQTLQARVCIGYSSTCPCSASLSRQLVERAFLDAFSETGTVAAADVAAWLREQATLATPHGQRSEAEVGIHVAAAAPNFGLLPLIDRVEAVLGTPLQTAVKRVDEQAFAARCGSNLMFVEDAARRIRSALAPEYRSVTVKVAHLESLHPHDAVAWAGP